MSNFQKLVLTQLLIAVFVSGTAAAKAPPEEVAKLGEALTPMGSNPAGNEEGTIPAWTGGITEPPAGYEPGDHHPDPFAGDEILFTITPENYQEYADHLTPGQEALFEKYDTYFMNVYPTRRSASFTPHDYEVMKQNAATGEVVANGEGVAGVAETIPFPLADDAYELMWNHKLKLKGVCLTRYNVQATPTADGSYTPIRILEELMGLYWKEGNTLDEIDNILTYFLQKVLSPARLAGTTLLVHETLNQVAQPRMAWVYNPGQRRVRRAPNVAYDNPGTASDGLRTSDMLDMFNGAMDRYNWELIGEKEIYVPYNSYKAHSDEVSYNDLVMAGHLNPELMRYELHRVYIVDARLKDGMRHIHPRRTFYLDEDSYQILLADHYDSRGELWRVSEAHSINYYEIPVFWSTIEVHYDLQSGRYIAVGMDNQEPMYDWRDDCSTSQFTPAALRSRGLR